MNRWLRPEYEPIDFVACEMARIMLEFPLTVNGEDLKVKLPIVVHLDQLPVLTEALTMNGIHYKVEPIEVVD